MASGIGLAALLSYLAFPREPAHSAPRPAAQASVIVVTRHAIAAGSVIAPTDLKPQLSSAMRPGAVTSANEAVGRVSVRGLAAGQVLLESDLQNSAVLGIATRVRQGERAFSIRVLEDEIVGGFLQSGNRVDIFATIPGSVFPQRDSAGLADRSRSVLLLQNIQVLAVGENSTTRGAVQSGARTVSFSLTPDQLARLTLALRFGKVSLAVRNPGDAALADATSAGLADLLPAAEEKHGAPVRSHSSGVPLLLGTKATTVLQDGRS